MRSEHTAWADNVDLDDETVEELSEIAEEARARGLEVFLDPRDVWGVWPTELEDAGAQDLAERVHELGIKWSWCC